MKILFAILMVFAALNLALAFLMGNPVSLLGVLIWSIPAYVIYRREYPQQHHKYLHSKK